jgi:hypothetical protein
MYVPRTVAATEAELKGRRDAIAKALKFINQRLKDKTDFSRQDLFGRDLGRGTYVQWSRDLTHFLLDEGTIARSNTTGTPLYHAVKEAVVSQESITRYMKREREEDELLTLAIGSSKSVQHVVLEEDEPSGSEPPEAEHKDQPPDANPEAHAAKQDEPELREMLAALIEILPSLVTATNRIERKVVEIEKAMSFIKRDFADLLALVPEVEK